MNLAKEKALQDMREELRGTNKSLLAFRKELNPIMSRLVREQVREQVFLSALQAPVPQKAQLVATCFFSKSLGTVELKNYDNYGRRQVLHPHDQEIL